MSTTTRSGYVRFDARKRLSLGRYTDVAEGDYAFIEAFEDGTIIVTPAPFPKGTVQ